MDEPLGCQEVFFFFIDDYFSTEKLWFFTK